MNKYSIVQSIQLGFIFSCYSLKYLSKNEFSKNLAELKHFQRVKVLLERIIPSMYEVLIQKRQCFYCLGDCQSRITKALIRLRECTGWSAP